MYKLITNKLSKRKLIKIVGLSLVGSTSYGLFSLLNKKIVKTEWYGDVLNNPVKLEIHSNNKIANQNIIKKVEQFAYKADNIFNLQNSNSEIVELNKNKVLNDPSDSLIDVIKKSQLISKETDGAFDITVQPLWNFYYNHFIVQGKRTSPNLNSLNKIVDTINWKHVIIKNNKIKLINNSSITLNGIAQGWITDNITDILKDNDIRNTLVDFGETYALGKFENKRHWNILLQEPGGVNEVISLSNMAVATSSGFGTMFEPTAKYNHIFNPKTGISENKYKAISILSKKAWLSDALATSSLLLEKNKIIELCNKLSGKALVVDDDKFIKLA